MSFELEFVLYFSLSRENCMMTEGNK